VKVTEIKQEIRAWSKEVLEASQDGHPVCPYANKSWQNNLVKIIKSDDIQWLDLIKYSEDFPDSVDVAIYCDFNVNILLEVFNERISTMNAFLHSKNLWVMGFHQDHDDKSVLDEKESFEPLYEESYNMVFLQRLDDLNIASERLEKIGYYNNWNKNEFQKILNRRN
tara:strand:- start:875 stop:1375 length:501 start_codon:yes stop_codon:yes gene_type:complete